jgi:hypothetical protein
MTRFLPAFLIFAFLIAFAGITSGSSPGDSQNQVLSEDSKDRMPRPDQKCSKICRRYECCEWTYGPYDRPICKRECCAEYVERCE